MMGSKADETGRGSDEIHHRVSFSKGFLIGKYELTQQQYELVMGNNPSTFRGPNLPVEMVTWNQATEFCKQLTKKEKQGNLLPNGWSYHLPTESQWEYACRAGTNTSHSFGEQVLPTDARWSDGQSPSRTVPVGYFPSNGWGIHEMHGNVWGWCSDWCMGITQIIQFQIQVAQPWVISGFEEGVMAEPCHSFTISMAF